MMENNMAYAIRRPVISYDDRSKHEHLHVDT
jgi:hypothetical protein